MKGPLAEGVIIWRIAKFQKHILSSVLNHFEEQSYLVLLSVIPPRRPFLRLYSIQNCMNRTPQLLEEIWVHCNISTAESPSLVGWKVRTWKSITQKWMVGSSPLFSIMSKEALSMLANLRLSSWKAKDIPNTFVIIILSLVGVQQYPLAYSQDRMNRNAISLSFRAKKGIS